MELGIREYRKYRIKVIVQGLRRKLEGSALEAVDLQDPVRRMMLDSMEIGKVAASLAVSEEGHKVVVMVSAERTEVMSNQLA